MSLDNFLVRPHRRHVEKYSSGEAWVKLDADARHELIDHVAGLPSTIVDDDLAAKQFDRIRDESRRASDSAHGRATAVAV